MEVYEIVDRKITYKGMIMNIAKQFAFEGKEYMQFLNHKKHKFIIMEKILENTCKEIEDNDLIKRIINKNFNKPSDIIE